ncbi:MAG: hypothetical protein AAGI91_03570 [Bacteroidota bacterium]
MHDIAPPPLQTVHGQPSWRIGNHGVETFVTRQGGHLGPTTFRLGERNVRPYAVAPWAEDAATAALPPMLRVLRGDFFCLPFGGNAEPSGDEAHPPHGEAANETWTFDDLRREGDAVSLHLHLDTTVRVGRVRKNVTLVDGHAALYQRHTVTGMVGPMSLGHHAMLKFPEAEGSGLVATSPFVLGQTSPVPVERPEQGGYSVLAPGTTFDALDAVPTTTGVHADLSRYPARRGYEDLVLLASDPVLPFAWTAVTFPDEGFVWFTLKDPRVLRQTILWVSNGGRHYPPWNGRHTSVLGLEEVTSYFHFGLAESAAPNPLSEQGLATTVTLRGGPFHVACISAVARVPVQFDHVAEVHALGEEDAVVLTSRSGALVHVPLRHRFLQPPA